jgi:hypothetical protein
LQGAREREQLPMFLRSNNVFINTAASAIAMCKIWLFAWPWKQQQQQLHSRMEKREVDQEELTATRLCAPAIPLYSSTTFAVHRTSSQSAQDRNRGGTQRSRQL